MFENAAVQQFVERTAFAGRFENAVERVQPNGRLEVNGANNRFKSLSNIGEIDFCVVDACWRELAEVLDKQEVYLVADHISLGGLGQEMLQETDETILIHQRASLQKLA